MAGEELLDKAIALIRIHTLGHSREPLCSCGKCQLLAEYDASRQRAGEGQRRNIHVCPACGRPEPNYETTVRVPREPTEAMLRAAMPWFKAWQHMRATDRKGALSEAYKAMLSAAEAER